MTSIYVSYRDILGVFFISRDKRKEVVARIACEGNMKKNVIPIKVEWGDEWGVGLTVIQGEKEKQETDYLSRVEKIDSLKREVKIIERKKNFIFSKLKPTSMSLEQDFKKLLTKKIKSEVMDSNFCQNMNNLGKQYFDKFDIVRLDDEQVTPLIGGLINKSSKKGWRSIFQLMFVFRGENRIIYMTDKGCQRRRNGSRWNNTYTRELVGYTYDIYDFFSNLLAIDYINQEVESEKRYYSIAPEELLGDKVYFAERGDKREYPPAFLHIPVFASEREAKEVLGNKAIRNVANITDAELEYLFSGRFIPSGFDYAIAAVPFREYFINSYLYKRALEETLKRISFRYYAEKFNQVERQRAEKEYSLSFETKRNIPKKTVEAMSKSKFNDYFGFVEFDELTDLKKIVEIENEFKSFINAIFGEIKETREIALRFRRLGHHKASGLYYPTKRCICVDIGNPNSFVHEYGHMIDYEFGEITYSESNSFRGLFFLYCSLFEENIKDKKDMLKGKYNVKYYETPTEVFARCFEIYVHRIIGMDNSIIDDCTGFAYPDDPGLNKMIKGYFQEILNAEGGAKKCASI